MLDASVRCEQKRLQRLSETVPANNWIPQAVWQGIPERRERRCVVIIQHHRKWNQLKDDMQRLLVLHYNYMPIFDRFQDRMTYWSKICIFRHFY